MQTITSDGEQAGKILSDLLVKQLLTLAKANRYPKRNRVIVLLSVKTGLCAGAIATLTWPMELGASGEIGNSIELHDHIAKKGSGRRILLHPDLRATPMQLRHDTFDLGAIVRSERGGTTPVSIANWFAKVYQTIGLDGCSSHWGRSS